MKCAVLGGGPGSLDLVNAINEEVDHSITVVFEASPAISSNPSNMPMPQADDTWESLLHGTLADVVIVGQSTDTELRAEQLRKLVQAAVPMILVHPACESIIGYELDMIRRDTGCIMVSYVPGARQPGFERMKDLADPRDGSPLGQIEQLVMERYMAVRDRDLVLSQFAQDAFLIRMVIGNVTQLSALGPDHGSATFANLNVHMSSDHGVLARWAVGPDQSDCSARVSLIGSERTVSVELEEDEAQWRWSFGDILQGVYSEHGQTGSSPTSARLALAVVASHLESHSADSDWEDACRACELSEVACISLRRGKTIELHNETVTEEDTFKGIMAAGGCGVLLFTLSLMLFLGVFETLSMGWFKHPLLQRIIGLWPVLLAGVLGVFLLLQLFRFVFPRSAGEDQVDVPA